MDEAGGALAGRHVLLGVTGGIAAYKAAALARALRRGGASVQAVLTASAERFVGPATFEGLTGRPVPTDVFAGAHEVPHVALAREADVAVIAPATANVLAKLATGLADDLLSSVAACLTCPLVVAPAMHTEMWRHPATQANVATLAARGARIVGPAEGELAGGDVGEGRLAEEAEILAAVAAALAGPVGPLAGRRVVVTAGGTREPIDAVRYLANRSSGKMGFALAAELCDRGAEVDLVSAPTALSPPPGARLHAVETAEEMRAAVHAAAEGADAVVKAAAVADWRPVAPLAGKRKKGDDAPVSLELEPTADILAELGAAKAGRVLVGFAAETDDAEANGRAKLAAKGLDLVVVNRVDAPDAGFGADTNRAVLLDAAGGREEVALTSKARLAAIVCDRLEGLLPADPPTATTTVPLEPR
ncbi:MAG: bifunctional phosphopantothenoylcysteine decarboxylase/phosphopantothenate--cysteine ligase CoaBC [Actinomycetota bacterium]